MAWKGQNRYNRFRGPLVKLIDDRKIPLSVFIHLVKLNSLTPLFTKQILASQSFSAPLNS